MMSINFLGQTSFKCIECEDKEECCHECSLQKSYYDLGSQDGKKGISTMSSGEDYYDFYLAGYNRTINKE